MRAILVSLVFLNVATAQVHSKFDHLLYPDVWLPPFQEAPKSNVVLPLVKSFKNERWNLYRDILESYEGFKNLGYRAQLDCLGASQEKLLDRHIQMAGVWKRRFEENCLSDSEEASGLECFDIHSRFRGLRRLTTDFTKILLECRDEVQNTSTVKSEISKSVQSSLAWNTNPNGLPSTESRFKGQWESDTMASFTHKALANQGSRGRVADFVDLKMGGGRWNQVDYYYDAKLSGLYLVRSLEFGLEGNFDREILRRRAEFKSQDHRYNNQVGANGTYRFESGLGVLGQASFAKIDTSGATYSGKETNLEGQIFSEGSGLLRKGIFAGWKVFRRDSHALAASSDKLEMGFRLEGALAAGGKGSFVGGVIQARDTVGLNRIYPKIIFTMETARLYGFTWGVSGPAHFKINFDLGYDVDRSFWASATQSLYSYTTFQWFFNENIASLGLKFAKENHAGAPGSGRENVDTGVTTEWQQRFSESFRWISRFEFKSAQVVFGQDRSDLWMNPSSYSSFYFGSGIQYEY